jgi:UDP-N-acetylglucosamine--N-acetylmuramyl-(pentapeptide) pyrophosphoryl-undecaprenol N-acetylglucosamine transferase
MRILLAGGGTAGHTSPMLATADAIRRLRPDAEITCLGTARGLETRVVPAAGYPLELIPPVPLPRSLSLDLLRVPIRLRAAVRATRSIIERLRADVVVGFGGYVSTPAYLAARRLKVPVVIHEGNALPGLANRLGARFAAAVATSFPATKLRGAHFVGLPIRRSISTLDRAATRPEGQKHFGLRAGPPTLLVTGGSQGARRINDAMAGAARSLVGAGVQVLHVAGPGNVFAPDLASRADAESPDVPYVVVEYVDRMDLAYAAADAVVGRAGANSVTEAAAVGLPAVFVPLPIGNGEQARNAEAVVDAGGGMLVADADFTSEWASTNLPVLLNDAGRLARMGAAAAGLIRRDADDALAAIVIDVATTAGRR